MVFVLVFWLVVIYLITRWFSRRHKKAHRWLQRELPLWEERKMITPEQGNAILGFYKLKRIGPREKMDMVKALTIIGSLFVGIGVIFFVASNWQKIPAHLRTLLLLSITLSTLFAGYLFSYEKQGFGQLGKSLLLLASLFWGGTIALIGQIYHVPVSDNWYIILLWAFPIVPLAVFLQNDYVHILASVLFAAWNFFYTVGNSAANYFYPLIIFALMLPTAKNLLVSRRINIIGLVGAGLYCCFTEYEWLALLISAGLLLYYLYRSEEKVYLYTAGLSFIFWAITYWTVRPSQPNFYFLLPAAYLLYVTYKDNIKENLVIWLAGFLVWLNLLLASFSRIWGCPFDLLNFMVFQSLIGILMYVTGMIAGKKGYLFGETYKVFGYLVVFLCIYLLSFRIILEDTGQTNYVYLCASLFAAAVAALIALDKVREGYLKSKGARIEMTGLAVALLGNGLMLANPQGVSVNVVVANAALVIFALTNIFLGVEIKKSSVFTVGIVTLALFIITRYIDLGWKLREKSLFFIVGGIVILSLGTFLEKQRKKVIKGMKAQ